MWFIVMFLFCILFHAIASFYKIGEELFSLAWWLKCIVIGVVAGQLATLVVN